MILLSNDIRRFFFRWKFPLSIEKLMYRFLYMGSYNHMKGKTGINSEGASIKGFEDTGLLFVHIPKCAGIALGNTLFGNKGAGHVSALEYKLYYSKSDFNSFFKFAVVRDPWDRVYSAYNFLKKGGRNSMDKKFAEEHILIFPDFRSFVMEWLTIHNIYKGIHFVPQYEFICDLEGEIIVDHIARYENIEEEYQFIRSKSKKELPKTLPHMNTSTTKDSYLSNFTEEMIIKVADVYKKDIEILGYQFN